MVVPTNKCYGTQPEFKFGKVQTLKNLEIYLYM